MRNVFRIGIAAVVLTAWPLAGCEESTTPDENANGPGSGSSALRAVSGTDASSTASDLTTPEGIVGTVGALSWNGAYLNCTGTLVARQLFLTAAHCVVDGNGPKSGEAKVWFKQNSQQKFEVDEAGIRYLNPNAPALYAADRAYGNDLAVVPLLQPVPATIVQHVAPVFTGDLERAAFGRTGRTLSDAIQVGMGKDDSGWDGARSWGYLTTLRPGSGTIDGAPDPRLLADSDEKVHDGRLESNTDDGDSGGPVFMKYNGAYTVVAVTSGHDGRGRQVKAFTGSLDGANNAVWLIPLLGPDVDEDGVVDSADNCPPVRCSLTGVSWDRCVNTSQVDADGDGVGDSCDNCAPSVCDQLTTRNPNLASYFTCINPDQANEDGDGLGDSCDLCPAVRNGSSLADADGDFVGDMCDVCAGRQRLATCGWLGDNHCAKGYCIMPNRPGQNLGHCTEQPDDDGDGIPNDCDNCLEVATTDLSNANDLAESQYGIDARGDICESVPLYRVDKQTTLRVVLPPRQGAGEENAAEVVAIDGDAWVGCDPESGCDPANPPNAGVSPMIEAGVAFRFCDCLNGQEPAAYSECADRCDAAKWTPTGGFQDITIRTATTAARTLVTVADPDGQQFFDRYGIPVRYGWWFYEDARDKKVPYYVNGRGERSVYGFVGSHAISDDRVTGRDRDTNGALRTSVQPFSAPNYVVRDFTGQFVAGCLAPRCLPLLRESWLERINPPVLEQVFDSIDDLAILVSDGGTVSLNLPERDGFDVTAQIDVAVMEVLATPDDVAWFPPAENASLLASMQIRTQAAVVPREGSGLTSPALVAVENDHLVMPTRAPEVSIPSSSIAAQYASVVVPATGRAAFSASRNWLYVAGGSFDGEPIGRVRVYDFATDEWTRLQTETSLGETVLALALDVARDRLYVLDVDGNGNARLTQVNLRTGESPVLWVVPYTGTYEKVSLGVDVEGRLVLVAAQGSLVKGWRFAFDEQAGQVDWLGMFETENIVVLDDISFRGDVLAVPVERGSSYGFLDLGQTAFEERAGVIVTDL